MSPSITACPEASSTSVSSTVSVDYTPFRAGSQGTFYVGFACGLMGTVFGAYSLIKVSPLLPTLYCL